MPQQHTTAAQVRFVAEWFGEWSALQREDFVASLTRGMRPEHFMNGSLCDHLTSLNLTPRPPSIYHCQVKLFLDWVAQWSPEERQSLLELLRAQDAAFYASYSSALATLDAKDGGAVEAQGEQQAEVEVVDAPPPPAVVEEGEDEALSSAPSSSLSSPRPDGEAEGSRPDSGLDSAAEEAGPGVAE